MPRSAVSGGFPEHRRTGVSVMTTVQGIALPRPNDSRYPLVTILVIVIILVPGLSLSDRLLLMSALGTAFVTLTR